MIIPRFDTVRLSTDPYLHMHVPSVLKTEDANRVLAWLVKRAPWKLRVESFYEQHEFSLFASDLGSEAAELTSASFIGAVCRELHRQFGIRGNLELVDVSAHRLTSGQTIRIHNDYLGGEETHRFLIQLNGGWKSEQGGLLMLFAADSPESVRHVIMPTHAGGFAFEISPLSFHAVSSIKDGERYTLVYTFRASASQQVSERLA